MVSSPGCGATTPRVAPATATRDGAFRHVVDPQSLPGRVQIALEIEAVNDNPLAAGYYFVLGPSQRRLSRGSAKRYFGPFATRAKARLLQKSALALGLVEEQETIRAIAECRSIMRGQVAPSGGGIHRKLSPWHQEQGANSSRTGA